MRRYISLLFLLYLATAISPYHVTTLSAQDFEVVMKPKVGFGGLNHEIRSFEDIPVPDFSRFRYSDITGSETRIMYI